MNRPWAMVSNALALISMPLVGMAGSTGVGSDDHLAMLMLQRAAGGSEKCRGLSVLHRPVHRGELVVDRPIGLTGSCEMRVASAFGAAAGNVSIQAGRDVIGHYVVRNGLGTIVAGRNAGPLDLRGILVGFRCASSAGK